MFSICKPVTTGALHGGTVELQTLHRCSSDGCAPNDVRAVSVPSKVRVPSVKAWVEQTSALSCFWVNGFT
jgi:hypothetical protein